jgi:hypothetical protein
MQALFSPPLRLDRFWGPCSLILSEYMTLSPGVNWPERDPDYSASYSSEVMNARWLHLHSLDAYSQRGAHVITGEIQFLYYTEFNCSLCFWFWSSPTTYPRFRICFWFESICVFQTYSSIFPVLSKCAFTFIAILQDYAKYSEHNNKQVPYSYPELLLAFRSWKL